MSKPCLVGVAVITLALATAAGCSDDSVSATSEAPNEATTRDGTEASSAEAGTLELLGSWHRAQSCAEMLAAFEVAGLADSHRDWLQGNFFGGKPGPKSGDPCVGAQGPLEHDHFFTADGGFGSHDQNGEEVDGGDFEVINVETVAFPSHAAEFGYASEVLVRYTLNGDVVTFEVDVPEQCVDACADAYAWAVSAFASGPWERGEVPG